MSPSAVKLLATKYWYTFLIWRRIQHVLKDPYNERAGILLSRAPLAICAQNSVLAQVILFVTLSLCKSPLRLYLAILYSRKGKFLKPGDEEILKLC